MAVSIPYTIEQLNPSRQRHSFSMSPDIANHPRYDIDFAERYDEKIKKNISYCKNIFTRRMLTEL